MFCHLELDARTAENWRSGTAGRICYAGEAKRSDGVHLLSGNQKKNGAGRREVKLMVDEKFQR
jgi:hypothetical protein